MRLMTLRGAVCVAAMAAALAAPAAEKRPNIIVILSDDMGYSDIGAYGGEIQTPTLDGLASQGKMFTQFYNTARCCPSRASLLTGLYPHQAGVGHLIFKTPHEGYGDHLTSDCVTIAEVLHEAGYGTYMAGKWHLAPRSYDPKKDTRYWPTGRGFDHFYGIICGSASFWDPATLTRDTTYISPYNDPEYKPEQYYFTDAITDNSIKYVNDHLAKDKDKPFFLYMAYTAAHWPLHAPEEEIAKYKGKYAAGYAATHDARVKRVKELGLVPNLGDWAPAVGKWDEEKNKPAQERLMETYAAMVTRMDEGIGKLLADLKEKGELDNTLIFFLQDNGGCAEDDFAKPTKYKDPHKPMNAEEIQTHPHPPFYTRDGKPVRTGHDVLAGPPDTYTAYREEWANVSNAPFRKYKHFVHEGGISTPMIAYWPEQIKATSGTHLVQTPAHLIDLMPTIVEAAGASYPAKNGETAVQPMAGVSLLPALKDAGEVERKEPIFFEHEGNRAVRDGKWKLVATSEDGPWELYDMDVDRGEMHDLAAQHPDIVKKMADQWQAWAARSKVLPLGGWRDRGGRKEKAEDWGKEPQATHLTLKQGDEMPREKSLQIKDRGVSITAEVTAGPVKGVIVAQGASVHGYSLYADGKGLHFTVNRPPGADTKTLAVEKWPAFPFTVRAALATDGSVTMQVGDAKLAEKSKVVGGFETTPLYGVCAGKDGGNPVGNYKGENPFRGKLGRVDVEVVK